MMRVRRTRWSPAALVAMLAILAAVGGTALAGSSPSAGTAGKVDKAVKQAKQAKKKANKALKTASAAEKQPGEQGEQGDAGSQGSKGDPGDAGSVEASPIAARITGLATSAGAQYGAPSGTSFAMGAPEANVVTLSPNADIVVSDLAVSLDAAPGAAKSRTFALRAELGNTSPIVSCTIMDTDTTCDSGGTSATILANSRLSIRITTVGTAALAVARIGFRATSP